MYTHKKPPHLLIRKLLSQTLVLSPENQRLQLLFLVRLVAAIN